MSNIIELKNVNKWFDKFQALKEINLDRAGVIWWSVDRPVRVNLP